MARPFVEPVEVTPEEFEREVKHLLDEAGQQLENYRSEHRAIRHGADGTYEIDVLAEFRALEATVTVLVECKHQRAPVKRESVQILKDRLGSLGAQKAILVSSSGFQSGALTYAKMHGIALVQLADGRSTWFTRSLENDPPPPAWAKIPRYVGWLTSEKDGATAYSALSIGNISPLTEFLEANPSNAS